MTLLSVVIERCAVCNTLHIHQTLESTNSSGTDLDSRPVGMARSTMGLWVHRCRNCGYCNSSLKELLPQAKQTIDTESFQELRTSRLYPDLAKKFLSLALILENAGCYYSASSSALSAAWVCDDKKQPVAANHCRHKAISLLTRSRHLKYQDCSDSLLDDDGTNEVVLADMLRRTGQFEEVKRIVQEGHLKNPSDKIAQMLDYELLLAEQQNINCHTAEEVFNPHMPTAFQQSLGCMAQLVTVGSYCVLMLYFMINHPEKAELILFGGIIFFMLIIGFLDRLEKILFTKKPDGV